MSDKTQIRKAHNSVKIEGLLKEIRLKEENDVISGDIVISSDENSDHVISVYVTRLKKDGNSNRAWKGIQTIISEYVSIAALMKEGRTIEEAMSLATKIKLSGDYGGTLSRNEFYTNGEFVSRPRVSGNYFKRIDKEKDFHPKAEFDIECYIERMKKETKDDEETGRLLIDAIVPLYGGTVVPMEFVASGEIADYLETNYDSKKTAMLWGTIVNIAERVVTKKSGFGKDKEDITVNYTRELVITGGKEEPYDDDSDLAFTTEQVKAAWKVRESETLPALLKKSQDNTKGNNKENKTSSNNKEKFKF